MGNYLTLPKNEYQHMNIERQLSANPNVVLGIASLPKKIDNNISYQSIQDNDQQLYISHPDNDQQLSISHQDNDQQLSISHQDNDQQLYISHPDNDQQLSISHPDNDQQLSISQPDNNVSYQSIRINDQLNIHRLKYLHESENKLKYTFEDNIELTLDKKDDDIIMSLKYDNNQIIKPIDDIFKKTYKDIGVCSNEIDKITSFIKPN